MNDFYKANTLPDLNAGTARFPCPLKIGPYKIDCLLNKGGMSILYLGAHPDIKEPIAVKVLIPKYCKNKEMARRFLKEAEIIGMAHHPNIVRLYGQGEWEKGLYIAMEFIQGISLRQFIQQKSLTPQRALEIVLQVAYALCHLHTFGVIHRDLKPENILITETGEIKVIDFGIAQIKYQKEKERITQKKRLMGTPIYMSPEQKENPSLVSYPSDIYSLGIIAYELILGRLSHGVIHLALLPKLLRNIIDKALKADIKERYQDVVDFITDLSQYMKTLSAEGERFKEEPSEDLVKFISDSQKILTPKKSIELQHLKIGIAISQGPPFSQPYLDFFHLPENRCVIAFAESQLSNPSSILLTSMFRGMMRMALRSDQNQTIFPIQILNALNETIHQDPIHSNFNFSLLFLDAEKDQLSFASCKGSPLLHISKEPNTNCILAPSDSALGAEAAPTFIENIVSWKPGDILIIHSAEMGKTKQDDDRLDEYLSLPAQDQAEKILQKFLSQKKNPPKHTSIVLSIQRIF
jgi:serine/threonine protein kinase